ncbi:Unknown protein sequence [Pseudomonas amygdali pv. eriobotryae]|uniref:Uncharacterized protein n=1 Tax=Pseudomonas amygdali pv. eriobotryae TaxID=129137 RepID=A0A0N8REW3_PSEA0|nr:Unknown protein sequence [Pseudomonas amygdali pv. eriobotryae]RMM01142.1 hypothetical protein ALQ86_01389 [Pseudomonas amygdali pv. eriobotryae]RMO64422.1 hypothetical protein ALQ39_04062 [Pseudomonas amygdali pv. eriobotryae]
MWASLLEGVYVCAGINPTSGEDSKKFTSTSIQTDFNSPAAFAFEKLAQLR